MSQKANIRHERVIDSPQNASEMTGATKQDNLHLKTHQPVPNPTVTNPIIIILAVSATWC